MMPTDRPVLGIVFALAVEADAFERRVADRVETRGADLSIHTGFVAGRVVVWCVAGVGRGPAARAARLLIAGHRPAMLVSAGFAGGLSARLVRGRCVEPAAVRGEQPVPPLLLAAPTPDGPMLVTVDRIVGTRAAKTALGAATGAALVDMETLAVAEVASADGLSCRSLRVISDAVDDELPTDVGRLVAAQSPLRRLGGVIGVIGRRPGAARDLWGLWERAVVDGRTLAMSLEALVASLPAAGGLGAAVTGRRAGP
ncbi:MAG: hypothetical protein FJ284_05845 [Planctomycetes bacterium]|nr:hypothetical protein [Planctomycetota bacterium]